MPITRGLEREESLTMPTRQKGAFTDSGDLGDATTVDDAGTPVVAFPKTCRRVPHWSSFSLSLSLYVGFGFRVLAHGKENETPHLMVNKMDKNMVNQMDTGMESP